MLYRSLVMVVVAVMFAALQSPVHGRYVYVAAARDSSGNQTPQFAMDGLNASGARFSGPHDGWASSGAGPYEGFGINGAGYAYTGPYSYHCSDLTPQKWGEWTFAVPDEADKSGYYDVYYGIQYTPPSTQDMPPIWTMTNAGAPYVNSTQTSTDGANTWVKIATQLQFNRGQSYTTRCASPGLGLTGKRMNFDMVAWVFVKTNTATSLTAAQNWLSNGIDLAWTAPDPAPASYIIERKVDADGHWENYATVTTTTYSDENCPWGFFYYYRVRCVDAAGIVSGASAEVECRKKMFGVGVHDPNPADGSEGVAADLSDASVPGALSWKASNEDWFAQQQVYIGTSPDALVLRSTQSVDNWSYAPGPLAPNTDYYWRVDLVGGIGPQVGRVWHFKTAPVVPPPPPAHTPLSRITDLWSLANDGTTCYGFSEGNAKTVSAVWSDGMWIEETNRTAGVRVRYTPDCFLYCDDTDKTAIQPGDIVDLYGTLSATAGEDRVFNASYIRDRTIGSGTPIEPLAMTQRYMIGKQASSNTPGLPAGKGIYGAGLLVRCAGVVVGPSGADYFFLDDKTYAPGTGIKVYFSGTAPTGNVVVTGVTGMVANSPVIYATSVQ